MHKKIVFITGANGVGKTTVMTPLRKLLGPEFVLHDFDERGVPDNVGKEWRVAETQYWIGLGKENANKGIRTIVCGFVKPSEAQDPEVGFVFLDADKEAISARLWSRYQTLESIEQIERWPERPYRSL